MPFRDLLKKKEKISSRTANKIKDGSKRNDEGADLAVPDAGIGPTIASSPGPAEFKFIRSETGFEETIHPPSFRDKPYPPEPESGKKEESSPKEHRFFHLRKVSRNSLKSNDSSDSDRPTTSDGANDKSGKRRSLLHLSRPSSSRSISQSSIHVPSDLPDISRSGGEGADAEAQWEQRALLLAARNAQGTDAEVSHGGPVSVDGVSTDGQNDRSEHKRTTSDLGRDVDIQEAITLHESGDLKRATELFSILASPTQHNNPLAQVLYGLSLRHGWGCDPDPALSLHFLTLAASNSASIESVALASGQTSGGAAKGELVLSIFELGNSFRYGWGCKEDPVAARRYYETAAELGDTDAMCEVAWCYLEGYGGKKDKWEAAKFLRMADSKGVKRVGDNWIWKEKYNHPATDKRQ